MEKTIAAIATPHLKGGIAIIRISGENALKIASKIFKVKTDNKKLETMEGYSAGYGVFLKDKKKIDDGICIVYRKPRSYTGEDVVELCCHGGLLIADLILKECIDKGANLAEPGEFTKRAYLNDKLTLTQAEAINEIINAKSYEWLNIVNKIKNGDVYKKIYKIKNDLLNIQSEITAYIDYPEEDGDEIDYNKLYKKLTIIQNAIKMLVDSEKVIKLYKYGVKAVLIGKTNVGKSTLMNNLTDSEKSIVTDLAGTTRDIIEDNLEICGIPFNLVDTAGIREADNLVEQIGIKKAKEAIESADIKLIVLDGGQKLDDEDKEILKMVDDKSIIIINKSDLKIKDEYNKIKHTNIIKTNKDDKKSIEELKNMMSKMVINNEPNIDDDIFLNERQHEAAKKSLSVIDKVVDMLKQGITIDIISVELEDAISYLTELVGENASDDIINNVFKNFCVGK